MILIRSNLATLLYPAGGLEVRALVRVRQSLRFKSGSAGFIFSPDKFVYDAKSIFQISA